MGWGLLSASVVVSAASMAARYRTTTGEQRQQIKWFVFASALVAVGWAASWIVQDAAPVGGGGALGVVSLMLGITSLLCIPLSVGAAILKHRLYDIDLVINRALVYGLLTLVLALVYFGGVTATQALLQTLTGQEEQPQLAIVVSTLVIAALFSPLRRRIQAYIDRRFYRKKYDVRKTLEAFSAKLRDETDLDALADDLVEVVGETMQPAHVGLWMRPDREAKPSRGEEP